MHKRKNLGAMALFFVTLAILLSGCNLAAALRPESTATPAPTDTPAPPTPTRRPAPVVPLPEPQLLFRSPAQGESYVPDTPITLTFDQVMDQESVEAAFKLQTTGDGKAAAVVKGAISWTDERTMQFIPSKPLARAARYQVAVGESASNADGKSLVAPVIFDFSTLGFLEISEVQPVPEAQDLDVDTAVTVVFNRPVVPLTAVSEQDNLPKPLTFTPQVEGKGEWLNTSIYRFYADPAFDPATEYTVRVAADFAVRSGLCADMAAGAETCPELESDFVWDFSTLRPKVIDWEPSSGATYIGPNQVISVTFNQPMDRAAVEAAFTLEIDELPIPGAFRWVKHTFDPDEEQVGEAETLVFTPAEPLPRNATCSFSIGAGVPALNREIGLELAFGATFFTVKTPGIVRTVPANGQRDVSPYDDVNIKFASPMLRDGFMEYLTITPLVTDVYTYWTDSDTYFHISFDKEPNTPYQVSLAAGAPDLYGARLDESLDLRFTTGNLYPYATLNTGRNTGMFTAYEDTVIYASYRNVAQLDFELYRLDMDTFMFLNGYGGYDAADKLALNRDDLIRQWTVEVEPPLNQDKLLRVEMVTPDEEQLPPGLYYLSLTSPEVLESYPLAKPYTHIFIRSRINLMMKQSTAETLVWATDLATGEPVPELPLRLNSEEEGWHNPGTTDSNGLCWTRLDNEQYLWDPYFVFAGEPGDDNFAVGYSGWNDGITAWRFGLGSDYGRSAYKGYIYTDRPLYRPGQMVYFKGVVRADNDATYSIPEDLEKVEVEISDPDGNAIYTQWLPLSDMGTLHGEIKLDDNAALGDYYIIVRDELDEFSSSISFRLAEYKKPEYQVEVKTDQDAYLAGDNINVTGEATYYFGGPVANADVEWNLLSANYYFRYQCPENKKCPYYSWEDYEWEDRSEGEYYGSYGRLIAQGNEKTNTQGRVTFPVTAQVEGTHSQQFTLELNVEDITGQYVSNRTTAIVHRGEFYIGLAPQSRVVKAGAEQSVEVLTVDWDSAPVPNITLDVVFMEHRWYNVRKQAEDGNYYWTWTTEDKPVFTTTTTTGGDGQASASFVPSKSGTYKVLATGTDSRGNEIRSSTYIWVWGSGRAYWRQESNNRIELITDKEEYQVGDVAQILVPSPYTGTVKALVTIERGHILETEVRTLKSSSEVLEIPITHEHIPNIFVSVVIVQGKDQAPDDLASFKMGAIALPVSTEEKQLKITLTPDRDMEAGEYYRPRETAIYDVLITDSAGNPVEAELSLRLADLAVLALTDDTGATLLERYWSRRGLGVRTSVPMVISMEAHNRELAPKAKGGGGGGGMGEAFVRTNFADTAFWDPVVRTDKNGKAQVEVKLPDNLTTWRIQARAITADTLVGRAEVDILSTLDVLVRPVLPRFFVVGDQARISTIVHNNTTQTLSTDVGLRVAGLALEGEDIQKVTIPPGDSVKVYWPVTVENVDEVKVLMEALATPFYDGREDVIPVYHYSTPEVVATAGRLSEPGIRPEVIQLPERFDPSQGELTVQLDGSLTSATKNALTYLEDYPYLCVEQTVSRFLPNVLNYALLEEMGLARPELERALTEQVSLALQRLYNQQHFDGGWGWWMADESNVYLTAYVLQGMLEAHRAGFTVDLDVMADAMDYLIMERPLMVFNNSSWQANRLAYILYVQAEYLGLIKTDEPSGALGLAIMLFDNRQLLDHYGRAFLATTLGLLEPDEPTRVDTLLSELVGDAVLSATGTHWEESAPDYWNMNTDIRTTAIVLWSMSRNNPDSELLPNIVRWLMSVRKEGYWSDTQSTAWSLMGLLSYMETSGELAGDFDYAVYLNGYEWSQGAISKDNLDESQVLHIEIAELLVEEGNRLLIERQEGQGDQSGDGQLYYTVDLRYFLPVEDVKALDRGVIVARQYSRLDSPETYIESAEVGDLILVKLTLIAPSNLHYVILEDPLPAGCEAVDMGLKTTSVVGEAPSLKNLSFNERNRWLYRFGWRSWWFSHSEIRDEKVALFARYLPRGTYEYTYIMRASVPGVYHVIPTTAYQMYFPEVFGRSDGSLFVIGGK